MIAGRYDDQQFRFKNLDFFEVHKDMVKIRTILKKRNPKLRILLTVSPVPLTATATPQHVLAATTYSKSTLRSVCGSLIEAYDDIDYFPSYELIASAFGRGFFYEPDQRNVTSAGVSSVMRIFFEQHTLPSSAEPLLAALPDVKGRKRAKTRALSPQLMENKIVCEERLLEAFAR